MDLRALGSAVAVETALLVLAAFGGPHSSLGAVPWTLQLPGILLMLEACGLPRQRPATGGPDEEITRFTYCLIQVGRRSRVTSATNWLTTSL